MSRNLVAALVALLIIAGAMTAQNNSTSTGTISLNLSVSDDNGIDAVTEIITLKNIRASEIEPFIRLRLSRYGTVQVNDALNMLVITDKQPKIKDLSSLVRSLDVQGFKDFLRLETEAVTLKYIAPSTVKPYIEKRLSPEGSVEINDNLNMFIITDLRSRIENIKRILPQFDVMPKQATVEFRFYDITNIDASQVGLDVFEILKQIDGSGSYNYSERKGSDQHNYNSATSSSDQSSAEKGWSFNAYANTSRLLAQLDQISGKNKSLLVANPVVLVQNRKWGEISSYANFDFSRPYNSPGLFSDDILISVFPKITEGDFVDLTVHLELDNYGKADSRNTVESSFATAADRPSLVGKVVKRVVRREKVGIPGLKDIPGLGLLFGKQTSVEESRQLLVFVIPHICAAGESLSEPYPKAE